MHTVEGPRTTRNGQHKALFGEVLRRRPRLKKVSVYEGVDDPFYDKGPFGAHIPFYVTPGATSRHLARLSQDVKELHATIG